MSSGYPRATSPLGCWRTGTNGPEEKAEAAGEPCALLGKCTHTLTEGILCETSPEARLDLYGAKHRHPAERMSEHPDPTEVDVSQQRIRCGAARDFIERRTQRLDATVDLRLLRLRQFERVLGQLRQRVPSRCVEGCHPPIRQHDERHRRLIFDCGHDVYVAREVFNLRAVCEAGNAKSWSEHEQRERAIGCSDGRPSTECDAMRPSSNAQYASRNSRCVALFIVARACSQPGM